MAKKLETIILLACVTLEVIVLITCVIPALLQAQPAVVNDLLDCEPPTINCSRPQITHYEMLFTDDDLQAVASTIAGEAGHCSWEQQCMVGWCICNRFNSQYASTIAGVCRAPGQFHGYGVTAPTEENLKAAYSVLHRWSLEQQGVEVYRELGPEYLWFSATGDGVTNTFRSVY